MNQVEEMLEFQMTIANFQFIVGLAYAEPNIISANMQPLRSSITAKVDKGCSHRIPGLKKMYISVRPQIAAFFELIDHYIAGDVSRDKVIQVCEEFQNINLKKPVTVTAELSLKLLD